MVPEALMALGLVAAVVGAIALLVMWREAYEVFINRPEPLALQIARSLDDEPDQWGADGRYYVRHASGLTVWVANKAYGLHVEAPRAGRSPLFVQETTSGTANQRAVWKAYLRWAARHGSRVDEFGALLNREAAQ